MTTYTDVFGGANIYPSEIDYSAIALAADITLSWPDETSTSQNLATKIMDVTQAADGLAITLPPANGTGTGQTILFNNLGTFTFTVKDNAGVQVMTVAPGTLWQVYLTDNSAAAGAWETLQYGAAISQANASALAGTGHAVQQQLHRRRARPRPDVCLDRRRRHDDPASAHDRWQQLVHLPAQLGLRRHRG